MFATIIKILLALFLVRIAYGVFRGIRLFRTGRPGTAKEDRETFQGSEIEDADWEEIGDDDGKSS
jgi:hypothetical protein